MLFFSLIWIGLLLYVAFRGEENANSLWLGLLVFVNVANLLLLIF